MSSCRVCKADSPLYLCSIHLRYLEQALAEVPWLLEQLQITITKQDKLHQVQGKSEQDTRQMLNFGASKLASEVEITLARWVSKLVDQNGLQFLPKFRVAHDFIGPLLPHWDRMPIGYTPTPARLARWLAHHVNTAATREDVGDLYNEIITLTGNPDRFAQQQGKLVRAINRKDRVIVGPCQTPIYDGDGTTLCGKTLWADGGQTEVVCGRCGATVDVELARSEALKQQDLIPEARIYELMAALGTPVYSDLLQKWLKSGDLTPSGFLSGTRIVEKRISPKDARLLSLSRVQELRAEHQLAMEVAS